MKKLFLTCVFVSYVSGTGLDLSSITSSASSSLEGVVSDTILSSVEDSILDQIDSYEASAVDYLGNILGGTFNSLGGGNLLDVCYTYEPSPINDFEFSINVCGAIPDCSNAPDLSVLGYRRKPSGGTGLRDYCESIFGTEVKSTLPIDDMVRNGIDFNEFAYDRLKEEEQGENETPEDEADKVYGNGSPLNIINAEANQRDGKNTTVYKAIQNNDYEAMKVFKKITSKANSSTLESDSNLDNITVKYTTVTEYEDSLKQKRDDLSKLLEDVSLEKLAIKAKTAFNKIDTDTADATERVNQKKAQKANFLEEYKTIVDKWKEIEEDDRLFTEYKESIVYPTTDAIKGYDKEQRPNFVYRVEAQKIKKIRLQNEIDKQAIYLVNKAEIILSNELSRSMKFDRASALAEIEALLQ